MEKSILDLGAIDYFAAFQKQKELFQQIKSGAIGSALIFCRHYPVVTFGRRANIANLKVDSQDLSRRGIALYPADRGGDVTYHGPGQLVVYPLVRLEVFNKDIHYFLRWLEQRVILVLAELGIDSCVKEGLTGVWVKEAKICSIGIAVRNWISYHGLALNVAKDDLANFSLIRPCGMDVKMTSLETILNRKVEFGDLQEKIIRRFENA